MNENEFSTSEARPSRRGRLVGIVAMVAVLAIALGVAGAYVQLRQAAPAAPHASATPITRDGAVTAVESFLGRKLGTVDVSEPQAWPGGREVEVRETGSDRADAWVDVNTGTVIRLMLAGAIPETTTVAISSDQTRAAAEAFFKAHDISLDGLTATVKLVDHGTSKEYEIEWDRIENGVLLPDSRLVEVDPSNGVVFSFMDRRVATGPVPSPKIARDEAIRLATAASGLSNPKIEGAQLLVDSSPVWSGRLVWSVQLSEVMPEGWVSAFWVEVDALTGETIIAGQG
ncbi:MAG TPA: hypothetical protein VIK06_09000 [Candidatus Limnocylindrales bacterium]